MSDCILKLKIGRNSYDITGDDIFSDNGECVFLLTQSKTRSDRGEPIQPILSKKAVKFIKDHFHLIRVYEDDNNFIRFRLESRYKLDGALKIRSREYNE